MSATYSLPAEWLDRSIKIALVGVGGNGSEMLDALGRMHLSLKAVGHPHGLHVTAFDPDEISESNIVRQRFYPAEIGQNKAVTAIQRMNVYLGTDWDAHPDRVEQIGNSIVTHYDLVIGCVDSVSARNTIAGHRDKASWRTTLYLDLGNGSHTGQVVLGHLGIRDQPFVLPIVQDLFPEIADAEEEDDAPSCSAAESLMRQNFGVNRTMATMAANLLWNLLTTPGIDHHGYFIDTRTGQINPLRIDPALWASLAGRSFDDWLVKAA